MRHLPRSAQVCRTGQPRSRVYVALLPCSLLLLLSGCAGMGNYMHSTLDPFGDPNAPASDTINMQRARGNEVAVQPILPQPGDVWPGKLQPVPTLGEIQKHMNVPLGQAYQNLYESRSGASTAPYSVPPGATAQRMPPGRAAGSQATPRTSFTSHGKTLTHSSTPPGSAQKPVPHTIKVPATTPTQAVPIARHGSVPVGQTLMGRGGPVGIVSSPSNGRYQTVAPIAGKGGGILISNGNGTATLIQPNGQVVTIPTR